MNESAQNKALAQVEGLTCGRCGKSLSEEGEYLRYGSHEWFRFDGVREQPKLKCDHVSVDHRHCRQPNLPNYTSDLNAIARIEAKLKAQQWIDYIRKLCIIATGDMPECILVEELRCLVSATATQKREALLRALNLWEDGE